MYRDQGMVKVQIILTTKPKHSRGAQYIASKPLSSFLLPVTIQPGNEAINGLTASQYSSGFLALV